VNRHMMATDCRSPPDIDHTRFVTEWMRVSASSVIAFLRLLAHLPPLQNV